MSKNLIVYFSHSGHTRSLAELVQQQVGGDLLALETVKPYPVEYNALVAQTRPENADNYRPELKNAPDIANYDTVFVGTPNWFSTVSLPVASFLEANDFSGKTVAVFCTHGGGGSGHIEKTLQDMCPAAARQPLLVVAGGSATAGDVKKWLQQLDAK